MLGGILRRAKGASAAGTRASSTRIAVVGSGPSGFYSAKYLLKELPSAHVDVLDALPNPYGASPRGLQAARTASPRPAPLTLPPCAWHKTRGAHCLAPL